MDALQKQLISDVFALGWLKVAKPGEGMELASVRHGNVPASKYKFKFEVSTTPGNSPVLHRQTWKIIRRLVALRMKKFAHAEWDLMSHVPSASGIRPEAETMRKLGMHVYASVCGEKKKKNSLDFSLGDNDGGDFGGTPKGTIVFEDVFNTGLSTKAYADYLAKHNAQVTHAVAIFDWQNGAKALLEGHGIKTARVVTVDQFFQYSLNQKFPLMTREREVMEEWLAREK